MSEVRSIVVDANALSELVTSLFVAKGLEAAAARTVADSLVEADLEGLHSHGVMLVEMYMTRLQNGSVSTRTEGTIVSDHHGAVVLDAGNALGQLTGDQAMDLCVERARANGVATVAVRHGFHFGAARRYAVAAARQDCVGIAMCNTRPLMPAPGGAEPVVGNNPLAIALPTDGEVPIVLDMATSEAAMGKIRMAAKAGEKIPGSWAVTAKGAPTTDPNEAIAGMLLPTAGPKGFGLALIIDLISGLLSGGSFGKGVKPLYGDPTAPYDCSHLFIAIDISKFGDPALFRSRSASAVAAIREGPRAPEVDRIFTPGEPEWHRRATSGGCVVLNEEVAKALTELAKEAGVNTTLFDQPEIIFAED